MITYSQLAYRVKEDGIKMPEDLQLLFSDILDTLQISNNLLSSTRETPLYPDACKLINAISFEFLKDNDSILATRSIDGKKVTSKIEEIIPKVSRNIEEKILLAEILELLLNSISSLVIISENDASSNADISGKYRECLLILKNKLELYTP
ncbi:MAG: hypothetical protein Q8Q03_00795 [bacterium]|nr:hypothetical protein [bacterium]